MIIQARVDGSTVEVVRVRFWIYFEVCSILKIEQKASSNRSCEKKRVGVKNDSKALGLSN